MSSDRSLFAVGSRFGAGADESFIYERKQC
jgi:hypothetical protein